ncbi:DUF4136 domain-containing protein [Candidatus Eisenbacteria bacterium]|uniref:DUF4136 domain-containing protein n=1 Tax=Eiseniibacteriota bacterium TaxID=2212470 RepID=A0ABV6YN49_UNCEI
MKISRKDMALSSRPLILALTVIGTLLLLWSCTPDSGFNTTADYDTVVTHYDPDVSYKSYSTYYLADSVAYITDPDDTSTIERDDDLDELILSTVASNLNAYGYQRIMEPEAENPPDLFVPVSITTTEWVGAYYPYYPPGWWYPWYPGWGPGYPGYYPPVVYSYSTGTIFFDLWDFKDPIEEEEEFPVLWTATINGLLSSDRASGEQRIVESINQAFSQSWYLDNSE